MNWIQCILYGLTIGFSEFIPVSSSAQGQILQMLFGAQSNDYVRDLLIHISSLIAFVVAWKGSIELFNHNVALSRRRRGSYGRNNREVSDLRFIRAATIPMLLVMILGLYFCGNSGSASMIILLLIGGVILYLPERMMQGNKSARAMSDLDAWTIGAATALCVIPGFSRIGMTMSIAQMRGADKRHAFNWAYMLSVPALLLFIGSDLVGIIFNSQIMTLSTGFGGYLLLMVSSFAGTYASVYFMKNIILNRGTIGFAYYSWGAALFGFILYLL